MKTEDLKTMALHLHKLGLNITNVDLKVNLEKWEEGKKLYKMPSNNRHQLKSNRQELCDVLNLDWSSSVGIGTVLGFNDLRALDIDVIKSMKNYNIKPEADKVLQLLTEILRSLKLPNNYSWVTITPSGGMHIIFFSDEHDFKSQKTSAGNTHQEKMTRGLIPNSKVKKLYPFLDNFELRWDYHLNLPPSINEYGEQYKFAFARPMNTPRRVESQKLKKLFKAMCFEAATENSPISGYNLSPSKYHAGHGHVDYTAIYRKH
jgi:hypothetical protein